MADPRTPRPRDLRAARLARQAAIRRAEAAVEQAADGALGDLLKMAGAQLAAAGFDPSVLDSRHPEWSAIVEAQILPTVTDAYLAGLHQEVLEGTIDATGYAAAHLDTVRNRLVGVADTVFDPIRASLTEGWLAGEDIPSLAGRVDGLLGDSERWRNRATTIARTEVIGANNAGAREAARYAAGVIGHDPGVVVKQWLATSDRRTRETHLTVDGDQVLGLDATFLVGGFAMQQPGDPSGPAREVVQCRCTVLYLMPGDPGYPADLAPPPPVAPTAELPDPTVLADVDLESEVSGLMAAGEFDSPRVLSLMAELDRRDALAADIVPATPDPVAELAALDAATQAPAYEPLRRIRTAAGKNDARDRLRVDYECYIDAQYARAIEDTAGHMLSRTAELEGIDARDLFSRRLRSLKKHASEELQRWFADNGRLSFDEFRGARARSQGWESEFG